MPAPKTIEEFASIHGVSIEQAKRGLFNYIDLLLEMDISDETMDCGLYHNHQYNSPKNMIESHKAILFAKYEQLCGEAVTGPTGLFLVPYIQEIS